MSLLYRAIFFSVVAATVCNENCSECGKIKPVQYILFLFDQVDKIITLKYQLILTLRLNKVLTNIEFQITITPSFPDIIHLI